MQRPSVAVARRPRKSALSRVGSVLGYLALAGGCANIVGLSGLEDEDAVGTSGSAGRGGSAGKGGSSGSAGKGGGAGEGAQANEGGSAGEPTGAGGAYTGPVDCNGDPFELNEQVVRSCLLYESCYPYGPDTGVSLCVTLNLQQAFSGRSCTKTAETCADVLDCTGAGFVDENAPVTCSDSAARCEDNLAVNCGGLNDIPPFFIDCDAMGGTCGIRPDDIADCIVNDDCDQPDPGPGESYASGCVENTDLYYYCAGGVGYGYDCNNFAANCEETDTGGGCFYSVTSCGADSVSCSGDTAVQCIGGERYQYDCGSVGLSCAVDPPNRYCLAPGCTTTDADTCEESCNGSKLTFCYGGAEVTVDCEDYGFESCREVTTPFAAALCTNL